MNPDTNSSGRKLLQQSRTKQVHADFWLMMTMMTSISVLREIVSPWCLWHSRSIILAFCKLIDQLTKSTPDRCPLHPYSQPSS